MAGTLIKTFAPVIAGVVVISEFLAPYLIMLYYFGVACWQWADKHGGQPIKICVGLFMCFCGGAFFTSRLGPLQVVLLENSWFDLFYKCPNSKVGFTKVGFAWVCLGSPSPQSIAPVALAVIVLPH